MERGAGGGPSVPECLGGVSMKKLISILVVFGLLAGVAFAQDEGSWSVGGSGRIGTRVNFLPLENSAGELDVSHATVWADGWDQNRDNVKGSLSVDYRKGGLSAGLGFDQGGGVTGKLSFNGENWQFGAEQNFKKLLGAVSPSDVRDSLWGNFTFQALNGIKLEAAVSRTGQQWWNVTDYFGDTFTHTKWGNNSGTGVGTAFGMGDGLNSASYLLLDVSPMAGLNIGVVVPNVFVYSTAGDDTATADLQSQALQYAVFGAKYADGPLAIGFQFALKGQQATFYDTKWNETNKRDDLRSGIYFGATYQVMPELKAGLEFRGLFGRQSLVNKDGDTVLSIGSDSTDFADIGDDLSLFDGISFKNYDVFGIGAQADFTSGPFGVNVRIRFTENNTATTHSETFYVRVRPYFDLVEGYLRAQLVAELTFKDVVEKQDDSGKNVWTGVMDYVFQPEIYFNFLGTGAGNWDTGLAFRYRWTGPAGYFEPTKGHNTNNFFELVFNWKF